MLIYLILCRDHNLLSVFNARGFPQLISITNILSNTEAIFKLVDFYTPISSLYVRTQILGERDKFDAMQNSVVFKMKHDCITVLVDNVNCFQFNSKEILTSLVETLNNTCYVELLKMGDFSNFKTKKNVTLFFDQTLNYFFENNMQLNNFCWKLKKIVLDEKNANPKCGLYKIYTRFCKNIVDASSFEAIYKVLVCKILASFSSSKHEQNIEYFMENYNLN